MSPPSPDRIERRAAAEPSAVRTRDLSAPFLVALLLGALVYSVRDILSPLIVYPLVLVGLWPLRRRPGIRGALLGATLLTTLWVVAHYGALLGPFFVALILAYLLAPLVDRIERLRTSRGLAIVVVVIPLVGLVVLLVAFTAPQVWAQAVQLVESVPRFATFLMDRLEGVREALLRAPFLDARQRLWIRDFDASQLGTIMGQNAEEILAWLWGQVLGLLRRLGTVFGVLGYLVVSPVVAFYLLRDWKGLLAGVERLIPPVHRPAVISFLQEYDRSLGRFVRGQLLEATLVGFLTGVGLAILGVPSALLLGVVSGVFNLVPYVGLVLSVIPALVVALTMDDPLGGLWRVALVYGVVQFIDGSITGPRIVGESVGLHPVWIMLALGFGGAFLGLPGLVLAVPAAVLLKLVGRRVLARYKRSAFFQRGVEGASRAGA
ncbi:MAG TPA: AI-2E family transporter [Gemmatimonadales bacterium]|nr:AI-2E family transporter [Gemmatimonadales bacterium]